MKREWMPTNRTTVQEVLEVCAGLNTSASSSAATSAAAKAANKRFKT